MALTKIDDRGLTTPIDLLDNEKIRFGTGNDIEIYHTGSHGYIDCATGNLLLRDTGAGSFIIRTNDFNVQNAAGTETMIWGDDDGAVKLYYDGSPKFETTAAGITVSNSAAAAADVHVFAAASQSADLRLTCGAGDAWTEYWKLSADPADHKFIIRSRSGASTYQEQLVIAPNGAVELAHGGSKKIETTSAGINIHEATDKVLSFSGGIGEIGSVPGFQGLNTAGSALTSIGMRGTDIRFATDNTEKLRITSGGSLKLPDNGKIELGGVQTGSGDLEIYHTGSHAYFKNTTGYIFIRNNGTNDIRIQAKEGEDGATVKPNGAVELYYDNAVKIGTTSFGFYSYGHIYPATTQNKDLGSSSYRWDYIYADHALDTSDRNLKNTIQATDLGLSFVNKLNPVSYKLNGKDKTHYGLIAQEVEEVITEEGKTLDDFGAIVHKEEIYSLAYNEFISPLIKAVQELSAEVEALKAK